MRMHFDKAKFRLLWRSGGMTSLAILGVLFVLVLFIFYKLIPVLREERINNVKNNIVHMTSSYRYLVSTMANYAMVSLNSNLENLDDDQSIELICKKITLCDTLIVGASITLHDKVLGYFDNSEFTPEFSPFSWDDYNNYFTQNPNKSFMFGRLHYIRSYPKLVNSFAFKYLINNRQDDTVAFVTLYSTLSTMKSFQNIINPYPDGKLFIISEDSLFMATPYDSLLCRPAYDWICDNYCNGDKIDIKIPSSYKDVNVYSNIDWTIFSGVMPFGFRKCIYILPSSVLISDIRSLYILIFVISNLALFFILMICYMFIRKNMSIAIKMDKDRTEIEMASTIQRSMLSKPLNIPNIDIGTSLIPALIVGGDLYYFFQRDRYLYFCIGDVSGKGVPAALFMSLTVSLFRDMSRFDVSLENLIDQLNKSLCASNDMCLFVTMFLGVLDIDSLKLTYCNAGHDEPLLWNHNSSGFIKTSRNLPFGVMDDANYKEETIQLDHDSVLMLYTDGITEAKNEDHQEYGIERLTSFFENVSKDSSDKINQALLNDIHSFVGNNEQSDDITILTIKLL